MSDTDQRKRMMEGVNNCKCCNELYEAFVRVGLACMNNGDRKTAYGKSIAKMKSGREHDLLNKAEMDQISSDNCEVREVRVDLVTM